jgi:UDP-2-acetamido-2-deoxy-ribo-hexuluronate aminotransferase
MITYNGWDRHYQQHKTDYHNLFDQSMLKEYEGGTEELEEKIKEHTGRKYAVSCSNATDALQFSLMAHRIGPGDQVMCSNFSWISTASCISMVGAMPVFCDIDLDSYHMSIDSVKALYNKNVKALIYTHLFGNMSDTTEIENFCKENNIVFIEDSAQSLGSSYDGRKAGTIGDCSSYSFNGNKVIAGISGGGMWMTDDEERANFVRKIRRHGKGKDFEMLGRNSKMYVINADIISYRLQYMEEWQKRRQEIAAIYTNSLDHIFNITHVDDKVNHNYHKYVIRYESKELRKEAKRMMKDIGYFNPSIHYEKALSDNTMYAMNQIQYRKGNTTNAQLAADTVMTLPCHAWMTDDEAQTIANMVSLTQ